MAFFARLHPLLVHFPIALLIAAFGAEVVVVLSGQPRWRIAALANLGAGAVCALLAALAGWSLASQLGIESTQVLEWHRWLGTFAAGMALAAVVAAVGIRGQSRLALWSYRGVLLLAAALVAAAGHFGGVLVWGAEFLRP